MGKLLWEPSEEVLRDANMTRFIDAVNATRGTSLSGYNELYQWSIDEVDRFWETMWSFAEIEASKGFDKIVTDLEAFPPTTKWFPGAELNFAQNLLRFRDDELAILSRTETRGPQRWSFRELYDVVSRVASSLKDLGIKPGDRVVGYMPNLAETVIAMLAATSLGATWSSCGAELGASAALDRLGQVEPRVLFTVDGYSYKDRIFPQFEKLESVVAGISSLEKVVVFPNVDEAPDVSSIPNGVLWEDFAANEPSEIDFAQMPFEHPLYIMFSSGTTGKPKCMVQGAGGVLINHLKELLLHTDFKRSDRMLYITSPSWMMWNWLVSGLAVGGAIVLYDGNPLHPDWRSIWDFMAEHRVSIFGCSASYLHYLKGIEARPGTDTDQSALRAISQTGSALSPEGFDFVYGEIKKDLHFNSISGGTDINGCFAAGTPLLPVYSGELQARALAMRVQAYNDSAEPVFDTQGELVCETPAPSMPIYFWNDENNQRYHGAYFDYFDQKKVWRHGDYIVVHKQTGGVTFYGRSDSTLKPSGVRIGTSEIYNVVENFPEVADSLAIGQQYNDDQRILLFVQMQEGHEFSEELQKKIRTELRSTASPRHVPALIFHTPDIPYTFSGKKVESAVTNIIHARKVTNRGALRNPESLDYFENILPELR